MTCRHAMALIDAAPIVDVSRDRLQAARAHARECPSCGPALVASDALTTLLPGLAEPSAPEHLRPIVMARIATLDARESGATAPAPVAAGAPVRRWRDWAAVAALVAGILVIAGSYGTGGRLFRFWDGAGFSLTAHMPSSAITALALALGLFAYLSGLFATVRHERRR